MEDFMMILSVCRTRTERGIARSGPNVSISRYK
jgi:hypothetical protein